MTLDAASLKQIDDLVLQDVQRARLPGAVALIWRDGQLVYERAIGLRDPQTRAPMGMDSIFRIYSMTKPIVSVAIMMLVEAGRLRLADPVSTHLPEFARPTLGLPARDASGRPVLQRVTPPREATLHDLLRHTAGLTYGLFGTSMVKTEYQRAGVESGLMSNNDMAVYLAHLPLAYAPGTVWEYSRATDVLGALIERISGLSLGAFLLQHVLGPLKMNDTGFHVPRAHHGRIAEAFSKDPDTQQDVDLLDVRAPRPGESGGGGMVSTASDYMRFCRMLLGGGTLEGVRLLSPKTVAWMTSDHLGADVIRASKDSEAEYLPGDGYGFGLGFAVRVAQGEAAVPGSVGDYGWQGLGGTCFWVDPAERLIALWLMQAPGQRDYYRHTFRSLVYASL